MKKSPARNQQQSNTLLNYFARTPKSKNSNNDASTPTHYLSSNIKANETATTPTEKRSCAKSIKIKTPNSQSPSDGFSSGFSPISSLACKGREILDNPDILSKHETPSKRKTDEVSISNDEDDEIVSVNKNSTRKNKRFKRIFLCSEDEDRDEEDEYIPDELEESSDDDDDDDEEFFSEDDSDEEVMRNSNRLSFSKSNKKSNKGKDAKNLNRKKNDNFIVDDNDDKVFKIKKSNSINGIGKLKSELKELMDKNLQNDFQSKMFTNDEIAFKFVQVNPSIYNGDDFSGENQILDDSKEKPNTMKYAVLEKNKKLVSKISSFASSSKTIEKPTTAEQATKAQWPHLSYKFLQPENIKDLDGNSMLVNGEVNPQYDSSTLYVPLDFLQEQTPALRQWWELKSKHFDTILFFKMGKFYEFFHMDAVLCTKELKILFMRGENAHAGFPEKSYKQYADALIQKGYKVARVEQTETPEMMIERCKTIKKPSKFDKVVKREICRISSLGTRYMSDIDSDTFLDYTTYLMAFTCKTIGNSSFEFGVSFVDVSIGRFFLAQFQDDRFHSKLRTLVSHYSPKEILIESSNKLSKLIQTICPSARLQQIKRFWLPSKTLKYIYEKDLWSKVSRNFRESILDTSDVIQQTAKPEFELAIISIGAIIEYLEQSLIIDDIITMGQFEIYQPPEYNSKMDTLPSYMILDSMTMKNLEIFDSLNNNNRSKTSTLFNIIDNCATAFGKRMLRYWICQPLCGLRKDLELRREAVRELAENEEICHRKRWNDMMKKIPDLDRLLTQIHSQSLLKRSKDHPDARAILFESDIYRMRRIKTFLDAISGFEKMVEIVKDVKSQLDDIKSRYIHKLITYQNHGGSFPQIEDKIKFFRRSFDADKVRKEGNFIPDKGVDEEYDQAIEKIEKINKKFDDYLKEQQLYFKIKINYVHANKNRYTLEIPDSCDSKISKADEEYEVKSSRKGFKRYYTPKLIEMVEELEEAESQRENILGDIFRRLLAKFDQDYTIWRQAIFCISQFDALMSLSNTRQLFESNGSMSCMPEFLWDQEKPMIRAKDLRNAFLLINNSIIPNNIELQAKTLILTGPNMGGKTTLMRSIGLMAILAQIGAYVPASECQLTPIDRIFTRIGAYDLVLENESTFMVELSEALAIIKYASPFSLALIDELGSGTSTFDGTAIASAIIFDLSEKIKCRTIFSTHYHTILSELKDKDNIKLGFMSYMIENENDKDPTEENIIFLYQLQSGICNKSYGFNVAKLAGIPLPVIRRGYKYAKQFELECQIKSLLNWFRVRKQKQLKSQSSKPEIDDQTRYKAKQLYSSIQDLKKLKENNP